METTQNPMTDIFTLADKLRALREYKDAQSAILKDLTHEISGVEYKLTEAMTAAECPNFTRGDKQFIMMTRKFYSPEEDAKSALYAALREQGYEHLFTVNSQTLSGFVRDLAEEYATEHDCEDGLPDWLAGLVKTYEDVGITMKAKKSK